MVHILVAEIIAEQHLRACYVEWKTGELIGNDQVKILVLP
jgi:hypothetical protein